jgi:hypothetical protein
MIGRMDGISVGESVEEIGPFGSLLPPSENVGALSKQNQPTGSQHCKNKRKGLEDNKDKWFSDPQLASYFLTAFLAPAA